MEIGVVYPQTELPTDRDSVREYIRGVEQLGYRHVMIYDHVVGADRDVHLGWDRAYDVHTTFHEPMVFFGYLAAITSMELVTGVVILPQRQTALVAKQAAEIDLLTAGNFRLGVGVGWNAVEYEALGQPFELRGRRLDEQLALLRRLWTEQTVSSTGRFDQVTGAGIAPLPIQRPIPLWLGGMSKPAFRRIGRQADGWFPQLPYGEEYHQARTVISDAAIAAGRDPDAIGVHARVSWLGDADQVATEVQTWDGGRAGYVSINTMGAELTGVEGHLEALAKVAARLCLG